MSDLAKLPEVDQRFLVTLHHRARALFAQILLRHGKAPGLAEALARARVRFLDAELASVLKTMPEASTPVACAAGCASCCTLTVEITPDETLAIARYLERALDEHTLDAVKARARFKVARSAGLDAEARHALRLFCPALDHETGHCMVHPVRPAPCQGYFSLDRRRCEADHRGPAVPIPQPTAADYIRDAVMAAQQIVLEEAGLSQRRAELSEGLLAVWDQDDAERRWLDGTASTRPA